MKYLPLALVAHLSGCSIPIDPNVTVEKPVINVQLCLALVDTTSGVKEELVYCDAGASIPFDAAGVLPDDVTFGRDQETTTPAP